MAFDLVLSQRFVTVGDKQLFGLPTVLSLMLALTPGSKSLGTNNLEVLILGPVSRKWLVPMTVFALRYKSGSSQWGNSKAATISYENRPSSRAVIRLVRQSSTRPLSR